MDKGKDRVSGPTEQTALEVDVRGLVCPEPVVRTKKAFESAPGGTVTVVTDSAMARGNIVRFAERAGGRVVCEEREPGVYALLITRPSRPPSAAAKTGTAVLISSNQLGRGVDELGDLLMGLFLRTLAELSRKPAFLVLMNSGVKLSLAGSDVLESLRTIENQGTGIRVCGTCLDFYGVKDQVRAGTVSNMYELAEILLSADKIVTL